MTEKEMKKLSLLAECRTVEEVRVGLSLALESPIHRNGKTCHCGLARALRISHLGIPCQTTHQNHFIHILLLAF